LEIGRLAGEQRIARLNVGEPLLVFVVFSLDHGEKRFLNIFGHGTASAGADPAIVDVADRRYLRPVS
jgi:hypothetical protein